MVCTSDLSSRKATASWVVRKAWCTSWVWHVAALVACQCAQATRAVIGCQLLQRGGCTGLAIACIKGRLAVTLSNTQGNKDSADFKLVVCNSSIAHHVSCMIAVGDTQAEGSGLGSPDAPVISCPPEKPGRQVQVKPPCVLTQLALVAQPAVCRTHSLMSMLQLGPSNLDAKYASVKASAVSFVLDVTAGMCSYAHQRRPATSIAGHRKHK